MTLKPEDVGTVLASIERRLRALETGPRAPFTSITDDDGNEIVRLSRDGLFIFNPSTGQTIVRLDDEGFTMFDGEGDHRARVGRIGTRYGVQVLDADGVTERLRIDERGILTPYMAAPFRGIVNDTETTTSGTFESLYSSTLEQIVSPAFHCTVVASAPAGTTGEMRLRIPATAAVTDAVAIPDGGTAEFQFRWLHGLALSAGPVNVDVQARMTSGAGPITMARPSGIWQTTGTFSVSDGVP